jgi:segregation and condensation protein A
VAPVRASVAEAVDTLREELARVGRSTFSDLSAGLSERLDVIVRFLAVLEMFKQGLVDLHQAASFSELEVSWLGDPDEPDARSSVQQWDLSALEYEG